MATIKTYTDVKQSQKLAEILPLDTADFSYLGSTSFDFSARPYSKLAQDFADKKSDFFKVTPCWSLAALWSTLPIIKLMNSEGNETECFAKLEKLPNGNVLCYYDNDDFIFDVESSNPVDACVEMFFKLKNQNKLSL